MNDILIDIELVVIYLVIFVTTVITIWSGDCPVGCLSAADVSLGLFKADPVGREALYGFVLAQDL